MTINDFSRDKKNSSCTKEQAAKHRGQWLHKISFLLALVSMGSACQAAGFETWKEDITCGEASYKLESVCKKAADADDLNECKSQSLEITSKAGVRKVKVPELNKANTRIYKKSFGDPKNLFVIGWSCGKDGATSALNVYYSVSGGAEESSASYDPTGQLIEDDRFATFKKAIHEAQEHMQYIRSVMPN
jgi:hypothetical protein